MTTPHLQAAAEARKLVVAALKEELPDHDQARALVATTAVDTLLAAGWTPPDAWEPAGWRKSKYPPGPPTPPPSDDPDWEPLYRRKQEEL